MINTISITNLKQNTSQVIKQVKSGNSPVVVFQRSAPAAVILDPDYYEILEQALEDLEDLRDIEARKDEPAIPFDEYFAKRFGKKTTK